MARLSSEENLGFKAISDNLNDRGMRRESRHWVPSSIQQILRNPIIKGLMVYGRNQKKGNPPQDLIEVPGVFPPIHTEKSGTCFSSGWISVGVHREGRYTKATTYLVVLPAVVIVEGH